MNTEVREIKLAIPLTAKKCGWGGKDRIYTHCAECYGVSAQPWARICTQQPHILTSDSMFFIRDCVIVYGIYMQAQMNKTTRIPLI